MFIPGEDKEDSLSVPNIFRDDEFLEQLYSTSKISYSTKGYAMFCCHTGPSQNKNEVNAAIAGRRSDPEQITEGQGDHIPEKHYTTVIVHSRSLNSNLRPSFYIIRYNNEFRQKNMELAVKKGSYVNPLSMIAVARRIRCRKITDRSGWRDKKIDTFDPGSSKNIDILLFQERGEDPLDMGAFKDFVSGYCRNKYGREVPEYRSDYIPVRFTSSEKATEFLRESQLFNATDLKIRNGELSAEDFEKLEMFKIL